MCREKRIKHENLSVFFVFIGNSEIGRIIRFRFFIYLFFYTCVLFHLVCREKRINIYYKHQKLCVFFVFIGNSEIGRIIRFRFFIYLFFYTCVLFHLVCNEKRIYIYYKHQKLCVFSCLSVTQKSVR